MEGGVCLDFGANVVPLAELDIKSAYAPVPILLLPAAGRNVQVKTEKQGLVMMEGAQVSKMRGGGCHYLSRWGGGGRKEDFGCVTIEFTRSP